MIRLESERLRVVIDPRVGAGWRRLDVRTPASAGGDWHPLLRACESDDERVWFNHLASYLLAPWPNRVRDARFAFAGAEHRLRADWPDSTAIHGLVKDASWTIEDRSPVSASLRVVVREGYPWAFEARVRCEVGGGTLETRLSVTNLARESMPAGLGFHPFFLRRLWREERVRLRARLAGRYPAEGQIPTGPAAGDAIVDALAGPGLDFAAVAPLDDVFLGSLDGATLEYPSSGVEVRFGCSPELGHAVVYSGDPECVCVEPVTMVNDALNRAAWPGSGLAVVEPGDSISCAWSLEVRG